MRTRSLGTALALRTGRGRWANFGLLHAAGYTYAEIAECTGTATGDIGAELEALRHELG